jgi:hypothetical protein
MLLATAAVSAEATATQVLTRLPRNIVVDEAMIFIRAPSGRL